MSVETFIVQLHDPLTTNKVEALTKAVVLRGGRIELVANKGAFVVSIDHVFSDELRAMPIVSIDHVFSDELRAMPIVKLIGGVGIRKRSVPLIKKSSYQEKN
ncbi:hypothetical protein B6U67_01830 [Methanosarcinales archaeon ex4484_138]|nr:MAG: hypothetical protein B6U67_01830 [Methanosarcinales archaeon ex4484_138]